MEEKVKRSGSALERFVPILLLVSIGLAFAVGVLWQKVSGLEKGKTTTPTTTNTTDTTDVTAQQPKLTLDQVKNLFKEDVIKFGKDSSKLILVEVSDTSCPYCHVASGKNPELNRKIDEDSQGRTQFKLVSDGGTYVAPVVEFKKLIDQGKASFVYIYSPGHGNGEMGAQALYCANEKGKFWAAHDLLMTNKAYDLLNNTVKNDKSKSGDLATFLASAVDSGFMKTCLESGKYVERIKKDVALATSLGAQGTPFFAVNENTFPGAYSFDAMKSAVDTALK
ncbi:MAG: DSBA-like protein thioredoxin domain-containing protein [Candidatus Woesebacteria bacterium GW2011_GWA1_37_8]|uniref:DSBA-like protein thioredoxin domain-containing protein n=2 Tax=Candidatus Woeseibacteriota TaxID=1752722 RepID=A0A0G0L463_9BACT|nr:MAG: DSBA-like protein thioredoxin domain-containing protein [Candidatus Woesebacteria bacterium GW2011_GWA1_37_8]KKQ86768.1 MAG: DSBA-like protein thioredoxin domain-containing protein [Candidatus Woesebacteria bacterium GW2011_GWB1_38_8b]